MISVRSLGVCIVLMMFCGSAFAQSNNTHLTVYPVRDNHKWGYYSLIGNQLYEQIPARYDLIADEYLKWHNLGEEEDESPYRLFETDGKLGLLDESFNEIIPNICKRIRPLNATYFAVEVDSLYTLLKIENDKDTILWAEQRYRDIIYAEAYDASGKPYFFVQHEKKWGVLNEDGEEVVAPIYDFLKSAGYPGFFKARRRSYWGLVKPDGKLIFDYKYGDIAVYDENTFAVKPASGELSDSWLIYVDIGGEFKKPKIDEQTRQHMNTLEGFLPQPIVLDYRYYEKSSSIKKLNPSYLALQKAQAGSVLYDLKKDEVVRFKETYTSFHKINEVYFQAHYEEGLKSVLDTALNVVLSKERYVDILPAGIPGKFRVKRLGKWGIMGTSAGKGVLEVDYKYGEIHPFENGIAIVKDYPYRQYTGAISCKDGNFFEVNPQYDYITVEGDILFANTDDGDREVIWERKADGAFEMIEELRNIEVDEFKQFLGFEEAAGKVVRPGRINTATKYIAAQNAGTYIKGVANKEFTIHSSRSPYDTSSYLAVLEMAEGLVGLYHFDRKISNDFTREALRSDLSQVEAYHAEKDIPLQSPPLLGFRRTKSTQPYLAFIDEHGLMGLMDRNGEQKKNQNGRPVRYTYIGPFQGGYARVCKGGALFQKTPVDDDVIALGAIQIASLNDFVKDFNIKKPAKEQGSFSIVDGVGIYALAKGNDFPRWGFINEEGEEVLTPQYDYVSDYSENDRLAHVISINEDTIQDENTKSLDIIHYGLLDSLCQLIIQPEYRRIGKFNRFYVLEKGATPVFFYDNKGRQVLVNRTRPRPFSEGFSIYKNEEGLWGAIDTLGNILVSPQFKRMRRFSDGLAAVVLPSDECAFINRQGQIAFVTNIPAAQFNSHLGNFSSGRCPYRQGNKWGYLDKTGNLAIPCQYLKSYRFVDGAAAVKDLVKGEVQYAVIDSNATGFIVPRGKYTLIEPFNKQGFAKVQNKEQKWGMINTKGEEVIRTRYDAIRDDEFVNGYVRVRLEDKRLWGLVGKDGKMVLKPEYAVIDTVSEGMVALKDSPYDKKYQIYDIRRKRFLKDTYEAITPFQNGVALARRGNHYRIINKRGRDISPDSITVMFYSEGLFGMDKGGKQYYGNAYGDNLFIKDYPKIEPHANGVAKIRESPVACFALNDRGVSVIPPKYANIYIDKNGFIKANPNRFYGLMDQKGRMVVPPEYDRIIAYTNKNGTFNGFFRVEVGEKVGYIRMKGGKYTIVKELSN
jgi:hypothetical protein